MLVQCSNNACTIQFSDSLAACPSCGSEPAEPVELPNIKYTKYTPTPPKTLDPFEITWRRVQKMAGFAGFLGLLAGVLYDVAFLMTATTFPQFFQLRFLIKAPFAGFVIPSLLVTGIALLFAPPAFYNSPTGQYYLKKIGATDPFTAKVVIALAFFGVVAVITVALTQIGPSISR